MTHREQALDEHEFVYELEPAHVEQLLGLRRAAGWRERSAERVARALEGSYLVAGVLDRRSRELVAFCRVISDGVLRAWIVEVLVHPSHQRMGWATRLLDHVIHHPRVKDVERIALNCRPDVVDLYRPLGFEEHGDDLELRRERRRQ